MRLTPAIARSHNHQVDKIFCLIKGPLVWFKLKADDTDFKILLDPVSLKERCENLSKYSNGESSNINIPHNPNISAREPFQDIYGKYDMDAKFEGLYAV